MIPPKSFYREWSSQCCPHCYVWLPSMDLRLEAKIRNYSEYGETYWAVRRMVHESSAVASNACAVTQEQVA